jgi:hypothetical protein
MKLFAQKVPTPPALEEQLGAALTIDCYRIGNTAAIVTRENVAPADQTPNFRWHLSLAHESRRPTEVEFEIAIKLLPNDLHYGVAIPHSGWPQKNPDEIHVWEIQDPLLTERWEADSAAWRA